MSGTYPATAFTTVNFKINTPTLVTRTNSGKSRRVGQGHSFYTFTIKHPALTRAEYGPIAGFIAAQYGPLENWQIVLPEISYSKVGNQTSTTVTTSAAFLAGVEQVTVSGVAAGKNLLRAGDFFKFANHSKVYMCTETWTLGNPLHFSGSLVADVPSGTALVINAVPFTVTFENEVQEFEVGVGGITQVQLDVRESW